MTMIGWYSQKSADACGYCLYSTIGGSHVAVTEVTSPGAEPTTLYDDLRRVGPVDTFLKRIDPMPCHRTWRLP
jgi:hypothetical protein